MKKIAHILGRLIAGLGSEEARVWASMAVPLVPGALLTRDRRYAG